ncbi:MAG TPA: D-alanyl-D-alanine carboxypeptidase [Chitinophagaceae bacterium]|nr:D-alanyl-D-alanine carboxypeptidase [Chitinophagaceae bacterium]
MLHIIDRPFRSILLLIAYCLLLIVLFSCSTQKQIAKSAKENVLNAAALQTAHVGISIYEPAANKYWYNYQGEHYFVPASNTKIPTCYAAMKYLGDSLVGLRYNITTDTILTIVPTGDPTFLHPDYNTQPVFTFLKKFRKIIYGGGAIESLGSGWSWNDYEESYMAPMSPFPIYGNLLKIKWLNKDSLVMVPRHFQKNPETGSKGFKAVRKFDENVFYFFEGNNKEQSIPFVPGRETIVALLEDTLINDQVYWPSHLPRGEELKTLKTIYSQPTDSLLKPMMHRSDNFFAEQSLLMVSNERLGIMNDAKIIDTLLKTDFKDLPQKPRWVDGSGLSRYNLFTPQDFVAILNKMKNEFGMDRIKVIFPTGGEGTISSYYKTESGYIFAKTGILSGVVAISGFLYTKKNKLLIFSVLINNHNNSATDVRRAIEKFLQGMRNKY